MREIKFRAWDKKVKHMFFWSFPEILEDHVPRIKDLAWMQFTGLKDKNGKEIYEGDVVSGSMMTTFGSRMPDVPGVIVWNSTTAGFATEAHGEVWLIGRFVQVIGNIYENPELLTPQKVD